MKDTLYTIPLTDAFKAEDECPFCFIQRKLEQDALSFTLGCAYMEDDIRATTDEMGFCSEHFKKMYEYGNRLGNALILHTHFIAIQQELSQKIEAFIPTKNGLLASLKKVRSHSIKDRDILSDWIHQKTHSCYICNSIEHDFNRYMKTFFYLIETNEEFNTLFKNGKGFCLPHFGNLIEFSHTELNDKYKEDFYSILFAQMQTHFKRIEEDLSWFIDKFDYRNKESDWKTSKDAIPRSIQKLSSIYVQDLPFKEK